MTPRLRAFDRGRAAVLEGIRRAAGDGATVAYVATTKPFYRSFGFRHLHTQQSWIRQFDDVPTAPPERSPT